MLHRNRSEYLSKFNSFRRLYRCCYLRKRFYIFSDIIIRSVNSRVSSSSFLRWKHEICRDAHAQHSDSMRHALFEARQKHRDVLTRTSSLERFRHSSFVHISDIRNRFALVDDLSQEISDMCRRVDGVNIESLISTRALSQQGQLFALETALVSLATCLSPWTRPRLNSSLLDFVEMLRIDLVAIFENRQRDADDAILHVE